MRYKKNMAQLIFTAFFITLMVQTAFCEDAPPVGQSKSIPVTDEQGISADIFGQKGGRFHPFLLFEAIYTDNLFATNSNTKDDFITTIAPGIWLAFPANREKLLAIDTTTTSPGGLNLSRIKPEATRRYQSYFLYSPEFVLYSDYSTHDHVNHRAEGLLQYNFNSGLSFDLIDIFHDREEIAGNGITNTLYRHQDNLLDFITTYDAPSGKFKLQATYSNYDIDYKDDVINYRDRNDNSFGISAFYKFWPKTSLFVEYNYSDIDFDAGATNDSVENRYYAGVNWDITAKTRGTLKLGYIDKDFDLSTAEDQDNFSLELQTQHNLTPKRALQINGYRKFHESDLVNASSFLSTGIDIGLMQRFTEKWSGTLNAFYEQNKYNGFDRDDDLYGFGPAIRFEPKKWLIFDLGYQYHHNNSNITFYDYKIHQIFLRISLSM
ncbi:MAG: outer membrane beta-barrel protein [Desulfobacula sp.]|uniref:outer membrane beta-barrel protein n=1 Tax=Desulfobacula sp. TaxID=2593537 RepID=UPI0025BE645A|nr:outer membrane beta-barrel protein [Desulfobacula sp.]MCD4718875.1 outer membrane beta-barrel protein [Desulfobacula sp.]